MSFELLPAEYVPAPSQSGDYIKMPPAGESLRLKLLTPAVIGWEYWTADTKAVRSVTPFTDTPGIRESDREPGKKEKPKEFFAFVAVNTETGAVGIAMFTQVSVKQFIYACVRDGDVDLSSDYALKITTDKKGQRVSYTCMAVPIRKPVEYDQAEADAIDLKALLFPPTLAEDIM